jgi:3-oxoacyl-[acyl-carrier-protein] synthase-1
MAFAIRDCLDRAGFDESVPISAFDPSLCAVLVLAPDLETLRLQERDVPELLGSVMTQLGMEFSPFSQVLPLGRAGLAGALEQASALTRMHQVKQVLLVAADSLLESGLIEQLTEDERLMYAGQREGFIPAEAAAAVLLCALPSPEPQLAGRIVLQGWGQATEAARWNNETPNRAVGLTQAMRAALERAKLAPQDLDFRVSDQNGEVFYTREAANAFTRLMASPEAAKRNLELLTLADKLGELGCAMGVTALSVLHYALPHPLFSPGRCGLVHLSQDDGLRCAVVVQRC